jgi:hypothetical protein
MEILIMVAAAAGIGLVVCGIASWLEERYRRGGGSASEMPEQKTVWGSFVYTFWFFLFGVGTAILVDLILGY